MIKYIYPDRVNREYNNYNQRSNPPIIHNNVSTYVQALMNFHESNPVPTQASQKRLKFQFNSIFISEKRTYTQEVPQLIQKNSESKIVTFNTKDDQLNYQQRLTAFGIPPNTPTPHDTPTERKVNDNNYASPSQEEDFITSFQSRIQQPTPPRKINPSLIQPHSMGGRGRGAYARYGGGRGGRGSGRGPISSPKYSTIHVNQLKIIATLDTHEEITLDSDSEESVNWKEEMSVMIKDLREFIMVDVKDMMDENMKEFMREIATSVRNDKKETLKDTMITKKGEKIRPNTKITTRTNNPGYTTTDTKT